MKDFSYLPNGEYLLGGFLDEFSDLSGTICLHTLDFGVRPLVRISAGVRPALAMQNIKLYGDVRRQSLSYASLSLVL